MAWETSVTFLRGIITDTIIATPKLKEFQSFSPRGVFKGGALINVSFIMVELGQDSS